MTIYEKLGRLSDKFRNEIYISNLTYDEWNYEDIDSPIMILRTDKDKFFLEGWNGEVWREINASEEFLEINDDKELALEYRWINLENDDVIPFSKTRALLRDARKFWKNFL